MNSIADDLRAPAAQAGAPGRPPARRDCAPGVWRRREPASAAGQTGKLLTDSMRRTAMCRSWYRVDFIVSTMCLGDRSGMSKDRNHVLVVDDDLGMLAAIKH